MATREETDFFFGHPADAEDHPLAHAEQAEWCPNCPHDDDDHDLTGCTITGCGCEGP